MGKALTVVLTEAPTMEVRHCKSCGGSIVWAETERGKRMPVDVDRSETGQLLLYAEVVAGVEEVIEPYRVRVASQEEREFLRGRLWTSHFAACPNAAAHRKAR